MKKFAIALATLAPLALASTAQAKDISGRFGIGGNIDSQTHGSGISAKYWFNEAIGFQLTLGGQTNVGIEDEFGLDLGARVLFTIARANDTNLYGGVGVVLGLVGYDSTVIDARLGAEHFFSNHFSVSGHVGLGIGVGDGDRDFTLGNNMGWGGAFHFYF